MSLKLDRKIKNGGEVTKILYLLRIIEKEMSRQLLRVTASEAWMN